MCVYSFVLLFYKYTKYYVLNDQEINGPDTVKHTLKSQKKIHPLVRTYLFINDNYLYLPEIHNYNDKILRTV